VTETEFDFRRWRPGVVVTKNGRRQREKRTSRCPACGDVGVHVGDKFVHVGFVSGHTLRHTVACAVGKAKT